MDASKYYSSTSGGATSRAMTASCSPNSYTCSAGTYLDVDTTCKTCPAGNYCPGGTWTYNDTNQGISPCPTGYTSDAGKSQVGHCKKSCTAGTYLVAKAASCSTCTAGNYCGGGSFNYSTSSNQGITTCPTGYPNSAAGSTKVQNCYYGASRYKKKTTRTCTKYESWTVTTKACGSSTSYVWSDKYTDKQTTCTESKFECNASTSGNTYVTCAANSCISGSNTCQSGYIYGAWGSYEGCTLGPDQVFPSDTVDCTGCKEGLYKCRFRDRSWSSCASGSNTCVSGYDISKWDCNANTTYAFGTASDATGQSTCNSNAITCDADHVGQNDVACTETSTYSFVDTLDSTATSCSTGTYFDCVSGKQGTTYISNCEDGDYYCPSGGSVSGSACYSP